MSLGEIIREARIKKNLKQSAVADKLFVCTLAVSKWERDLTVPGVVTIKPLIELLDIDPLIYLSAYTGLDLFMYKKEQ